MLRDWGAEKKYHHVLKGYNYRLEGIQGAVLRVKLRHLEALDRGAPRGRGALRPSCWPDSGVADADAGAARRGTSTTSTRSGRRDRAGAGRTRCSAQGIQTGIHYPIPVHLQPAFADLGYRAGDFPHSERAADEVLSLPMFPELTAAQTATVCERCAAGARRMRERHDRTGACSAGDARPLLIFPCNGNGLEALDCLGDALSLRRASSTTRRRSRARTRTATRSSVARRSRERPDARGARGARQPDVVPVAARAHRRAGRRRRALRPRHPPERARLAAGGRSAATC